MHIDDMKHIKVQFHCMIIHVEVLVNVSRQLTVHIAVHIAWQISRKVWLRVVSGCEGLHHLHTSPLTKISSTSAYNKFCVQTL